MRGPGPWSNDVRKLQHCNSHWQFVRTRPALLRSIANNSLCCNVGIPAASWSKVRIVIQPLVTVILPCFNVAGTVAETIASVQRQTLQDFEIVAVDNNSSDATAAVLARLAAASDRMRVVRQSVQGLSAARNAGIRAAHGRYIAFVDADDLWDPDYLRRQVTNLAESDADVSYCRVRHIDAEGRPTGKVTRPKLRGLTAADLLLSNPCTSLVVVRREVFSRAGLFDEALRRVEDQEWLFRVLACGCKLAGIDAVLASYRMSPGGLSTDTEAMLGGHRRMLDLAEQVAPILVQKHRRVAQAAMLRYCARRSLDQGLTQAAWAYACRMFKAAPDLLVREPRSTLTVLLRIAAAGTRASYRHLRTKLHDRLSTQALR